MIASQMGKIIAHWFLLSVVAFQAEHLMFRSIETAMLVYLFWCVPSMSAPLLIVWALWAHVIRVWCDWHTPNMAVASLVWAWNFLCLNLISLIFCSPSQASDFLSFLSLFCWCTVLTFSPVAFSLPLQEKQCCFSDGRGFCSLFCLSLINPQALFSFPDY